MFLSRRDFVRLGSLCAASAGLSLGIVDRAFGQRKISAIENAEAGSEIPFEAQRDLLFFMNLQTFSQYLGTQFSIDPGYTFPIETTLIGVKDTRSAVARKRNTPGQECFLLTFQLTGDQSLMQGTYQVKHDALGTFELFVVPAEDMHGRKYFEAVINRVIG